MRKTREILRLHFESHLIPDQIASICKVSRSTVQRCLERLKAAGLSWLLPSDLDDAGLEQRLYPPPPVASPERRCLPDCAAIHRELKSRKNVTLQLLWEEYKQAHPLGYNYSWYCELYREWQRQLVVLLQEHRAGEKMFVDYAGQTVPVTDPRTGEICQAQVLVAVLGASNYTYAEATWTQNLWDWTHSHVRAFEFFAGTAKLIVPDNLKSGVKAPCYYEPELNRTYGDLAIHYGLGILPARPYHPRDKSKAEVGVQVVQRWVLAALRKRQFFSLAELNEAILELVHKLNERPFRKMAGSRAELYRMIDRPALQPLPAGRFVYAEWKRARVNLDYPRQIDAATVRSLTTSQWVVEHRGILLTGPTGIGKTGLAEALVQKASRDGYSVLYRPAAKLFRDLAGARVDGSLGRSLDAMARTDVLLVDDFAMAPLNDSERRVFLEIADDRYGRRSTVLTSQLPVASWHAQIGDPTIADSILDRLVHNAYRIEMNGESMRRKNKPGEAEANGGRS
jgi:transposase/DNA replication protein DnaC